MRKITQFSVQNPVTVAMMVLGILLLGYISFGKLGVDLFPDLNAPRIFVEVNAGERPPEEMESQFIKDIEAQIIKQKGVSSITSVCKTGSAKITVEYSWKRDMDEAFLDLQKSLTSFSQNTKIDKFSISQHDPNASPVMLVAMVHNNIADMNELRKIAENYIKNELIRLDGVADIGIAGQQESQIAIETNEYILEAHNLTTENIATQIANFNKNVSGGSIVEMGKKYIIKGVSMLKNLESIENIIVGYKQESNEKTPIFLKNIANIKFENKEPSNIVRVNGKRCLGLSIYKEPKYNTVKMVEKLRKTLSNIQRALPGYQFTIVHNQGKFIKNAIGEVQETALLGIIFAVFVLFLFLRRFGITIIISIAIPISIIATFNLMYFNELSLNIMTLGGLALGAGMLVDNAIVVMENIFRKFESGSSIKEAAIEGTAQVGGAITAATLTTIVVFLPIVYLHGASGELFKDQAWTVTFSLLASLFVALLFIPMLVSKWFKNRKPNMRSVQMKSYGNFLYKVLRYRWIIIPSAIILLIITAIIIPIIGSEYVPKTDSGEFSIEIQLPEGTELRRTSSTLENIENIINSLEKDRIKTLFTRIGVETTDNDEKTVISNENTASIKVVLQDKYKESSNAVINKLGNAFKNIQDIQVRFIRDETALQSTLGTSEAPIVIEVHGKDLQTIENICKDINKKIKTIDGLYNQKLSIEKGSPQLDIKIDRFRAGMYNLSTNSIISQVKDKLSGKNAGKFENSGELQDIKIKLPTLSRAELENLKLTNGNQTVRLHEIAQITDSDSPKEILRKNQERIGKITAQIEKGKVLDHITTEIQKQIKTISHSPDYKIKVTGEEEKRQEAMSNLSFALILSIVLVYMVLASQFESLLHPFTILLTIPLAAVGAIWAFFILGISFNMMGYIGLIMLAGIAVNDSIILIDAIGQFRKEGLDLTKAITQAGQNRIRPILMTSLTTILALLPLTLGFGESASLRAPMAVAVIGGLVTSTLLTLVVIPCVYYVIDGLFKGNK